MTESPKSDDMGYDLSDIQRKKAEAERELKALDSRRLELEQWLRDLAITERTFARLMDIDLPDTPDPSPVDGPRRKKPDHVPSVYDMAVSVLRDRAEEFVDGSDIVAAIRTRWWPDAQSNDILPSLWRLATKDHRLRKEGKKYGLPISKGLSEKQFGPTLSG